MCLTLQKHRCKGIKERRRNLVDLKVAIVILYYFFFTFYNIATATSILSSSSSFENEVKLIFECEALGYGEEHCSTDGLDKFNSKALSYISVYVSLALYPSIFFLYLIKCKSCRKPPQNLSSIATLSVSPSLNHMTNLSTLKSSASLQNLNRISVTPVSMSRSKSAGQLV